MNTQSQKRPCGSCLIPGGGVIIEAFTNTTGAFQRHAQLIQDGQAPSLCMKRNGVRYVCHIRQAAKAG